MDSNGRSLRSRPKRGPAEVKGSTMTDRIRHAIARSTGATTLARKDGDNWLVSCLSHSTAAEPTESRTVAWKLGSHPQDWCSKCAPIAKGQGREGDRRQGCRPGEEGTRQADRQEGSVMNPWDVPEDSTPQEACASDRHAECDPLDFVGAWCGCSCHETDPAE